MRRRAGHLFVLILTVSAACGAFAQDRTVAFDGPFGSYNQLASPDGRYVLVGDPQASQLWLEDTQSHSRRKVMDGTLQTMTVAWSPSGRNFILNDRAASNAEEAYVYDAASLNRLDLQEIIVASDLNAKRYALGEDVSHFYVHALHWSDSHEIVVQLHGHTDGSRKANRFIPGRCFKLRYRISTTGAISRLPTPLGHNC
jgi:hypothetical protein